MGNLTEEEIRDRITDGYDAMCDFNEKGDYKKSFETLFEMWDILPGNKLEHEESYSVAVGIIETAIECKNKEIMAEWINKMDRIAEQREKETGDKGEKEYFHGKVAYELGNYEEARKNLDFAVKNGWRLTEYDKKYADFLAGRIAETVPESKSGSHEGKNDSELDEKLYKKITGLCDRGEQYADTGDFGEAKRLFLAALEYVPSPKYEWEASTWLYTALGDVSYLDGDYDSAVNYLNEALKCPDGLGNPFILLRLGESFFELHNNEKAKNYLLQAYMCDGDRIFEEEDEKYKKTIEELL